MPWISGATRRKHSVRRSFSASMDRPWCRPLSASRRMPKFRQNRRCHLNTASGWRRVSPNSNRRSAVAVSGNASSAVCSMSECRGEWSTSAAWRHCDGLVRTTQARVSRSRSSRRSCANNSSCCCSSRRRASPPYPNCFQPGEDERRAGLDAIRSVLSASAEISGEAAKRLDRVTELFGLAGKSRAKAS